MARFIHVVGEQGVGKSMLIWALAAQHQDRGFVCAGQHPDIFNSRAEALEAVPGADVYFIEHHKDSTVDALPGELVIRMQRVEATGTAAVPAWDGELRVGEWLAESHGLQALNAARAGAHA